MVEKWKERVELRKAHLRLFDLFGHSPFTFQALHLGLCRFRLTVQVLNYGLQLDHFSGVGHWPVPVCVIVCVIDRI